MADIKRQVAMKVRLAELASGTYIQESGLRPNYILTKDNKKISRVNVMGVVVSLGAFPGAQSFVLDDGSAKITVRAFEENPAFAVDLGVPVLVVGRPRAYNNEIYVLPEIVKPITDQNWIQVRKLELGSPEEAVPAVVEETVHEQSATDEVYSLIKQLDAGTGVLIDDVIAKIAGAEQAIQGLLSRGDVFEVSPGRVKVLD